MRIGSSVHTFPPPPPKMGKASEQSDESFEVILEGVWQEFGLGFPECFSSDDRGIFFIVLFGGRSRRGGRAGEGISS